MAKRKHAKPSGVPDFGTIRFTATTEFKGSEQLYALLARVHDMPQRFKFIAVCDQVDAELRKLAHEQSETGFKLLFEAMKAIEDGNATEAAWHTFQLSQWYFHHVEMLDSLPDIQELKEIRRGGSHHDVVTKAKAVLEVENIVTETGKDYRDVERIVARQFKTTVRTLQRWNGQVVNIRQPGWRALFNSPTGLADNQ